MEQYPASSLGTQSKYPLRKLNVVGLLYYHPMKHDLDRDLIHTLILEANITEGVDTLKTSLEK